MQRGVGYQGWPSGAAHFCVPLKHAARRREQMPQFAQAQRLWAALKQT